MNSSGLLDYCVLCKHLYAYERVQISFIALCLCLTLFVGILRYFALYDNNVCTLICSAVQENADLLHRAVTGHLVVEDFESLTKSIDGIYNQCSTVEGGKVSKNKNNNILYLAITNEMLIITFNQVLIQMH